MDEFQSCTWEMARKPRIEFPGAIYHVMSRGNYRKPLFEEPGSGEAFVKALFEAVDFSSWILHAYTVMSNHYHLLLETPEANLSNGMRWLQGTFANRFNRVHQESGHVFQGRFKSPLVEPGDALRREADYIHLNPVRAGIVTIEGMKMYSLSSYSKFWMDWRHPRLIRSCFLSALGLPDSYDGMCAYEQWLKDLIREEGSKSPVKDGDFQNGLVIGSCEYKETIIQKYGGSTTPLDWGGPEFQDLVEGRWEITVRDALQELGKTEKDLINSPKLSPWKITISCLLRERTQATNRWIAQRLNMGHPSNVSRYLKRMPKSKG